MDVLVIITLIISGIITYTLISLIIKEKENSFSSKIFKENFQKNKQQNGSERNLIQEKIITENSSDEKSGNNLLDFSGGDLGI